jgi:hypothetical protein
LKERILLQELRQFLLENVSSYDELEALLLLQSQPHVAWLPATAAQSLGLRRDQCEAALENLAAHGLAVVMGNPATFRYSPTSKPMANAAAQLQMVYRKDRLAIVQLMTTNAMDRVRASALDKLGRSLQARDLKLKKMR